MKQERSTKLVIQWNVTRMDQNKAYEIHTYAKIQKAQNTRSTGVNLSDYFLK